MAPFCREPLECVSPQGRLTTAHHLGMIRADNTHSNNSNFITMHIYASKWCKQLLQSRLAYLQDADDGHLLSTRVDCLQIAEDMAFIVDRRNIFDQSPFSYEQSIVAFTRTIDEGTVHVGHRSPLVFLICSGVRKKLARSDLIGA